MSNISKGAETERRAIKELEERGWRLMFRAIRMKFHNVDWDNAWDLILVGKDGHWKFVSVKTNLHGKKKELNKLHEWVHTNAHPFVLHDVAYFELWNWKSDKKEWEKIDVVG